MSSAVRFYIGAIVVCMGLAGCTPAHFVQRAQPVRQCQVNVCTNLGTGFARCECKSREQLVQQTRHSFWPHAE